MKIGVTSKNKFKLDAVRKAYRNDKYSFEIIGYSVDSGVGDQPVNEDTLLGARNRILDLNSRNLNLDRIISIESGIFLEKGEWISRAIVVIYDVSHNKEFVEYSEGVVFPEKYVLEAKKRDFKKTTVGQVMAERGYISDVRDPHKSISGISRGTYIEDAITKLVSKVEFN